MRALFSADLESERSTVQPPYYQGVDDMAFLPTLLQKGQFVIKDSTEIGNLDLGFGGDLQVISTRPR